MTKELDADVVVVGGGAGGATAALRLAELGLEVVVLERGPVVTTPPAQAEQDLQRWTKGAAEPSNLWAGASGPFMTEGSHLGGATNVFSGNTLRFHPNDFRRRTLLGEIAGASLLDWPLTYDQLEPYYLAVERELGVGGGLDDNPFEPRRSGPLPTAAQPLDEAGRRYHAAATRLGWHPYGIPSVIGPGAGRRPCPTCGLCTGYVCTYGARWSARDLLTRATAKGARVVTEAEVTRVLLDPEGERATGVEWARPDGAFARTRARAVVLAADTAQTPRILWQSRTPAHPDGIGNDGGELGRNVTTHAHDPIYVLGYAPSGPPTTRTPGATLAIQDFYENELGVGMTLEPRALGSMAPWERVTLKDPQRPADDEGLARYRKRFDTNLLVVNIVEDLPRAENRLTPSSERRDRLGLPLPEFHYRPHPRDAQACALAARRAEELLAAAGAEGVFRVDWPLPRHHVFGTARMGADPARSVVDAFGRAHRVPNLYVADGSVFVTSAGVNPLLTICALARRGAEHLAAAFARRDL